MPSLHKQFWMVLLYAVLSWFTLKYFSTNGIITAIYLPSGVALAALLFWGKRCAPGIFIGLLAGSYWANSSFLISIAIASGGVLAALSGYWMLSRYKFSIALKRLPDYIRLILWGAFAPAVISATISVTALLLGNFISLDSYFINMLQWWMGGTLGVILITPMILVWCKDDQNSINTKWLQEALLILGLTALAGQMIFLDWFYSNTSLIGHSFWIFLLTIFAATRLGSRGTSIAILIVAVQSLLSTNLGVGIFAQDLENGMTDGFWSFMIVFALVSNALAIYLSGQNQAQKQLLESESRLRTIIEAEPECVKIVDSQGCLIHMNQAGLGMIEADSMTQVVGGSVLDLIAPEYRNQFASMHTQVLAGHPMQMEFEIIGLKGRRLWMETHATPLLDNGKTVQLAITRDITERKVLENDLRIAAITFESQEGILISDASNRIIKVNRAFTRITGYSPEDVLGKNPKLLNSGRQDEAFYAAMWESIQCTGAWEGEIWNRRKNGEVYPESLTITAVKSQNEAITHYVALLTDISLRKAAEEDIRNLAFYDPLTQLPNRRLLLDRLKHALASSARSGKQGALLFIDLDHFKNLNDTLGHDFGDLLLQQVANRLIACVREGDTVARLGGDEFVVMLEDLGNHPVEVAALVENIGEKILLQLNQPYQLGPHKHHSTPSIGATLFADHDVPLDELLKQADIAMYQSKASGRNVLCFFDPQMQANITARVALEAGLRQALANNEFILHYQLQTTHSGEAVGAEALIRWKLPNGELMPPSNFIPLAEETGMIVPIGKWALETACAQLKVWEQHPQTSKIQLAVNVSARQFHQPDFVEKITELIERTAIRPDRLKLELTESLVLNDIEDTIQKMNTLRKIGVHFSMDDFGTGHSSLSSLKKLPLDQLKIDQSFIRDITSNSDDAAIVKTIIAMAKHMAMEIIAEGVETEEQRAFLEKHNCLYCQGFLFGRPMSAEALAQRLRQ